MFDNYDLKISILTLEEYMNEVDMSLEQIKEEHGEPTKFYVYARLVAENDCMRCFERVIHNEELAVRTAIDTLLMLYYTRW